MRFLLLILISPAIVWLLSPAAAQLTSGISAPEIREGAHSIGYRAAYDPDRSELAQRIHAERALTGSVAVRGVVQAHKTEARAVDLDYVQGELRWQITPDGARWASGLRLDARFRDGGRPGQVALHWLNQAQLTDTVRSRFSVIASIQTGSGRESGTFLQTRAELSQRLEDGVDIGTEVYNTYGPANDLLPVSQQGHLAGPFVSLPLNESLTLRTSALVGLTAGSTDATFRVFLTQRF